MSVITERVPLAEVSRQAREIRPGRTMLALVTGLLFGLGWLVAKLFAVAWLALAHAVTAVRIGWQSAQANGKPPRSALIRENADLAAEAERLRQEVARLSGG